jgi:cell filamentation protein
MILENKLGITDSAELARAEERISKAKAILIFEKGLTGDPKAGSMEAILEIHRTLFNEIYSFAGKIRTVNLSKGNFRFASAMYLESALKKVAAMHQSTFEEIIEKYVEMNIVHPFREGNGRSTRIWLDQILKQELNQVIDWSRVDKDDYLSAMERSPVKDVEIKALLKQALTGKIHDACIFMKGIDASYHYEGYDVFKTENLGKGVMPDRDKGMSM